MKGKANNKFFEWLFITHKIVRTSFNLLPLVCQQSLWVEWFLERPKEYNSFETIFYNEYRKTGFNDYNIALSKAIEKATEIFNNQSK